MKPEKDGFQISMKCNVAGDNPSIPAWEFTLQAPNGHCAIVTAGAVGGLLLLLLLPPVPRAGFPGTRKFTNAAAVLAVGSMNFFLY
jgi:hypothetical protein